MQTEGIEGVDIMDFISWIWEYPLFCCGWIVIGAVAGALARYLMRSQDEPIWSDLLLGLAGAIIGGFVTGSILGIDTDTSGLTYWLVTLVVATFGAMILVFVGRTIFGDRREKRRKGRQKRRKTRRRE